MSFAFYRYSLFVFLLLFLLSKTLTAVPAFPGLIEFEQPDGEIIELYLRGDEKINWAETTDGYTILATKDGEYQYAVKDKQGDLVFSGVAVSGKNKRNTQEMELLESIPQGLFFSSRQTDLFLSVWEAKDKAVTKGFPTTGDQSLLCILVETSDIPFTKTQDDFDALFNQVNYTIDGATGSLKDYYLETSYGQLNITVDVVGPFTAENDMEHYGSDWDGARELATEAVHLADSVVDYSQYDSTNDGWVDAFYMIFSGYGEEAGGGPNTIWSHAWYIEPVELDGVWVARYACSPELRGNSGENITRIGVVGHEFGHVLGAPDYYDTDGEGSGGHFDGTGRWDMMASGTWNNWGATPAHHNPYTKAYTFQWATPTLLEKDTTVALHNSVEDPNSFYRINTTTRNEFYLLENRREIGFDEFVPGSGLLIYHAHSQIENSGNAVNTGHPQRFYPVNAGALSNPDDNVDSYGDINSSSTPFPGSSQSTLFSDVSLPGSLSWADGVTNKPVSNISYNPAKGGVIRFDFMDPQYMKNIISWDQLAGETAVGVGSTSRFQVASRFEPGDLDYDTLYAVHEIHVFINEVSTSAKVKIWQGSDQQSLEKKVSYSITSEQSQGMWVRAVLPEPYLVDPTLELWVGAEFATDQDVFHPIGMDDQTLHDGKGNMIRLNLDSHENWTPLSEYDVEGSLNIKAILDAPSQPTQVDERVVADASQFTLFPNPAQDQITVGMEIAIEGKFRIIISDMSGRIVLARSFSGQGKQMSLDVEKLNAGVYLVKIISPSGLYRQKLVKQ